MQRLQDGHEELHRVLVLSVDGLEEEVLVVQDRLRVDVLDKDPKGLGLAVDFFIPLEVGRNGKLHFEGRTSDGLNVSRQFEFGELVDVLVDRLSQLGRTNQFANLSRIQVVQ